MSVTINGISFSSLYNFNSCLRTFPEYELTHLKDYIISTLDRGLPDGGFRPAFETFPTENNELRVFLDEKAYDDFVIKPNKKIQEDLKKKFPSTPSNFLVGLFKSLITSLSLNSFL